MDSVVLRGIYCWLRRNVIGGKILAVEPSGPKALFLGIRQTGSGMIYLVISWDAMLFRLYPSRRKPQKVRIPSTFVDVLRRHILGASIASVLMKSLERVVSFEVVNSDLRGNPIEFTLIAELMGKNSNLILIDRETQDVIEAGKHVTEAMSRTRPVQTGSQYAPPPGSSGVNPLTATGDEIRDMLERSENLRLDKLLLSTFSGISPTIAREIAFRAEQGAVGGASMQPVVDAFLTVMQTVAEERFEPCILTEAAAIDGGEGLNRARQASSPTRKSMLCAFPLLSASAWHVERFDSMAEAAEEFFARSDEAGLFSGLFQSLRQMIKVRLSRAKRRLENIEEETLDEGEMNRLFRNGELLKANMDKLRKGAAFIEVQDVFSESLDTVRIDLDAALSPWGNVDAVFKKAKKARRRLVHTKRLVDEITAEMQHLDSILVQIESCEDVSCLKQIADELLRSGLMTQRKHDEVVGGIRKHHAEEKQEPFRRFLSSDGLEILVGRSNAENDQLTFKTARPYDLFLHAKGIPGSHVIVWRSARTSPIPKRTIEEAAIIAAVHSKARGAQHVAVDYTLRSQVKKPKGAMPGKVIYSSYETVFVDPEQSLLERLSKKDDPRRTRSDTNGIA